MCGIAGFINADQRLSQSESVLSAQSMLNAIRHRGPDDDGIKTFDEVALTLIHTRLSIIDLSKAGHQPMSLSSGLHITYNGEIYNHLQLRMLLGKEEPEYQWVGHSDTEVLLRAIEVWGVEKAITRIEGMFAFAVYDEASSKLTLVRDRFGEKPLHYIAEPGFFAFSSECKALKSAIAESKQLNSKALNQLINNSCIASPESVYAGVYKLAPGSVLQVDLSDLGALEYSQKQYWFPERVAAEHYRTYNLGFDQAVDKLEQLLIDSVEKRLESDAPLGCLLSGGIDSSLITALAQKVSNKPVRTFTAGFQQRAYDESEFALEISRYLKTDHTAMQITEEDLLGVVGQIAEHMDEPFSDTSFLPTWLISECTKRHVDVVLTGDGGDELFCGYSRYFRGQSLLESSKRIPKPLRRAVPALLAGTTKKRSPPARILQKMSAYNLLSPTFTEKMLKYCDLLNTESDEAFYLQTNGVKHVFDYPLTSRENVSFQTAAVLPTHFSSLDLFRLLDTINYLPEDILVKTDRCSMGHGLEGRLPFLDRSIFEFCWSVPPDFHIEDGKGKRLLKAVLKRHVPEPLWDRPKKGFGAPVGLWIKNELRDWAEHRIKYIQRNELELFNVAVIMQYWEQHTSGTADRQYHLWPSLILATWLEKHA